MEIFSNAVIAALTFLFDLTGNLGFSLILFTLGLRLILAPLTLPSLKARDKISSLQPELNKLKKKHGKDKKAFQKAQLELYQKYNVNPLAGCLPQVVQIGVLIILYRVLINFFGNPMVHGVSIDPTFFWLNLTQPDPYYVIPVVAAVSQLLLSFMIAPGAEVRDVVPNDAKSKKLKKANEQEEDMASMAASMQKQMVFIMPIMTGVIAVGFPAGLGLYWIFSTVFSIIQQAYVSGWGGLISYTQLAQSKLNELRTR